MKKNQPALSATSLPVAPTTEADGRVKRYAITMGIRTLCFILMAVVQPMGWWTWVFGAGAAVLPYVAVVFANNPDPAKTAPVESPDIAIEAPRTDTPDSSPTVLVMRESPKPVTEE